MGTATARLSDMPDVLTPALALTVLPIGKDALYGALKRGDIPNVRIGRRILIPRAALERMLQGA